MLMITLQTYNAPFVNDINYVSDSLKFDLILYLQLCRTTD